MVLVYSYMNVMKNRPQICLTNYTGFKA